MMVRNAHTATGLVFNDDGKILMIKNKKQNKWLPPGGHVDDNELPCRAVAREVFEETGVTVRVLSSAPALDISSKIAKELPLPLRIMHVDTDGTGQNNFIDFMYLCRAENTNTTPQEAEIGGIGWFSPQEAIKLDTYEDIIKVIESLIR
jgi:8-oxo-dGTP pyrophosphatase MutT (NUDIX family)